MVKALLLGVSIMISYSLIAVNTIAVARTRYLATFLSSTLFMGVNFYVVKHIAAAQTRTEFVCYCIGGVLGDLLGIFISKRFHI